MSRMLLLATVALLAVGLVVVAAGSAGDTPATRTAKAQPGGDAEHRVATTPTSGPFALAAQRPRSPTQREVVEPYDRPRTLAGVRSGRAGGAPGLRSRMRAAERDYAYRAYFLDDLAHRLGVTNVEIRRGIREAFGALREEGRPLDLRTASADELARVKTRLAARIAEQLDRSPARVVEAVRAEMVDALRWAVSGGRITMEARARAVDCFDDPAACDVQKLRASLDSRGR